MEKTITTVEAEGLPVGLIYSPEQFDLRVLSGQFPLPDLIACHSHNIGRIKMDFRDERMEKSQWVQLFPKQLRQVGLGRFSIRSQRYYIEPIELLRANRVNFGHEVQVVYGGADFEDYLAGTNPRQDPEWFGAVRINRRIPAIYIKAIIPFKQS